MVINNVDITPVISTLLEILLGIITAIISSKVIPWIKEKLNAEQLGIVSEFIRVVVRAAEQVYPREKAEEKLKYAVEIVEKFLESKGMHLDLDVIKAMIEAAVNELHRELYPDDYVC